MLDKALFLVSEDVVQEFVRESSEQFLDIHDALSEALKEWTESQRYLRTGNGQRRFPTVNRMIAEAIEKRQKRNLQLLIDQPD